MTLLQGHSTVFVSKPKLTGDNMNRYLIIVEKTSDNYSAYSPDIPGCIATGISRDEVKNNMKKAIRFHLDGLAEDGLPKPEPLSFSEYIEA